MISIMSKTYLSWVDKHIDKSKFAGKNVFVTGGNSGVGFEFAKFCAYLGSNIFLLCRSTEKGEKAKEEILSLYPNTKVEIIRLDLADLSSIEECADKVKRVDVDIFLNNAGVFRLPKSTTKDGFEITMGTNFLGTYYLNYLLVPYFSGLNHKVKVGFMSSIGAYFARIHFDDFFDEKRKYKKFRVYCNSKLAMNSIYDKYSEDESIKNMSFVLTHPGITYTPLISKAYRVKWFHALARGFMKLVWHSPAKAALSALKGFESESNIKIGPRALFATTGYPHRWTIKKYKKSAAIIETADKLLNL